jgi:hypothetical protein
LQIQTYRISVEFATAVQNAKINTLKAIAYEVEQRRAAEDARRASSVVEVHQREVPRYSSGVQQGSSESSSVWYRLAECESSGNWGADTGNGYFGGLQWVLSTWYAYGGTGNPSNASAQEQIAVAEKLLAASGGKFTAWPGCRRKLGLP